MYLGSEWNASNLEELNSNGVTHVLNVTREIGRTQCVDNQGWEVGRVAFKFSLRFILLFGWISILKRL